MNYGGDFYIEKNERHQHQMNHIDRNLIEEIIKKKNAVSDQENFQQGIETSDEIMLGIEVTAARNKGTYGCGDGFTFKFKMAVAARVLARCEFAGTTRTKMNTLGQMAFCTG